MLADAARTAGAALHRRPAVRRRRRTSGSARRGADAPARRASSSIRCSASWRSTTQSRCIPGHGAGSLCGAGIGKEPSSTIGASGGRTRCCSTTIATRSSPRCSPTFRRHAAVLRADEARSTRQGRRCSADDGGARRLPSIAPAAAAALAADGALILDLRSATRSPRGIRTARSTSATGRRSATGPAGSCRRTRRCSCSPTNRRRRRRPRVQLLRVGLDRDRRRDRRRLRRRGPAPGCPSRTIEQVVGRRAARRGRTRASRCRSSTCARRANGAAGHVDGAINIPVGEIAGARARAAGATAAIATICEGGYRSSLAASLLAHEGVARARQRRRRHGGLPRAWRGHDMTQDEHERRRPRAARRRHPRRAAERHARARQGRPDRLDAVRRAGGAAASSGSRSTAPTRGGCSTAIRPGSTRWW